MPIPLRPELRAIEFVSVGPEREPAVALTDPDRIGASVVLSYGAATLAALMDGHRTLADLQTAFRAQTGVSTALADVKQIVHRLDEAHLLRSDRFERRRRVIADEYQAASVRPAAHAGEAYAASAGGLRRDLDAMLAAEAAPGPRDIEATPHGRPLRGLITPHIDPNRGASAYAHAYNRVAQRCDADRFVIFGTAHAAMDQPFCVSRKDFETPLGVVHTDQGFIDRLADDLASSVFGGQLDVFENELAHRREHSIEFQAVWLAHVLGDRREFRIVPILVGSFEEFFRQGMTPGDSPEVETFLAAIRAAAGPDQERICFLSAADLAHIGPHYGDADLLDTGRLSEQADDDRQLLGRACAGDADGFFAHVAATGDRSRICGLAPTYMMLEALRVVHGTATGRLLHYDQAVETDGSSCVSFAAAAFDGDPESRDREPLAPKR